MATPVRWLKASVFLLFGVILHQGLFETRSESDTQHLMRGAKSLVQCLEEGTLSNCDQTHPTQHFALFQYLPALPLSLTGLAPRSAARILGYFNCLLFFILLQFFWRSLKWGSSHPSAEVSVSGHKRLGPLEPLGLLVLISGPLLFYSRSSFGEMEAALLTLLLIVAAKDPKTSDSKLILLFTLAGITKETAFPFLGVLGWVAHPSKGRIKPLVLGATVCLLVNSAFNWVRFGVVYNLTNFNPALQMHDPLTQLSSFFGIWFSPSGGLFVFWPSLILVCLGVSIEIWRKRREKRFSLLLIFGTLLGLTFGFSKWYAPFGWEAWGPRLILPWLPACLFLILTLETQCTIAFWNKILKNRLAFFGLWIFIWLSSIPQFEILFQWNFLDHLFAPTRNCPVAVEITQNPTQYYQCLRDTIWPEQWRVLDLYSAAFSLKHVGFTLLFGTALFSILKSAQSAGEKLRND